MTAVKAAMAGDTRTATTLLGRTADYCDAQRAVPGRRAMSFATRRQYERYMDGPGKGQPTEWLDIACATAYQQLGYLFSGAQQWDKAMSYLDIASEIGPDFADTHTERGFVLGQQRKPAQALVEYQHALQIGTDDPESAYIKPIATRGIGYAKIELGDLDGARKAYEQSLVLEPGNQTALNELDYITQQVKQPSAGSAEQPTASTEQATNTTAP